MPKLPAQFWNKVNKTGTCWFWTGPVRDGYPQYSLNGDKVSAHRLALEEHLGRSLSDTEAAFHDCPNKTCVRPDHLYVGMFYTVEYKPAFRKKKRLPGDKRVKLTDSDIHYIRTCDLTQLEIAAKFGISQPLVSYIRSNKRRVYNVRPAKTTELNQAVPRATSRLYKCECGYFMSNFNQDIIKDHIAMGHKRITKQERPYSG